MASPAARRKRRFRARSGAVLASLAAHLIVLGWLAVPRPSSVPALGEVPALSVDLVRTSPAVQAPPPSPRPSAPRRAPSRPPAPGAAPATLGEPVPASAARPVAPGAKEAPAVSDLTAALRRSGVGCANADAVRLSEIEREGCRRRLAQGAAGVPYISGVPPKEREYYAALADSEAKMDAAPMGGHGPGFVCGGGKDRLGLKLGPCKITAPLSPWIPEADVRPPN